MDNRYDTELLFPSFLESHAPIYQIILLFEKEVEKHILKGFFFKGLSEFSLQEALSLYHKSLFELLLTNFVVLIRTAIDPNILFT